MLRFGKRKLAIASPMKGRIIDITEVADPVFAGRMMGDGFAVEPEAGVDTLLAPCDAEVLLIPETQHAVALLRDGAELLLHVGIDTVSLKGRGFRALVKEGDSVKLGTPLLRFDRAELAAAGKSCVTILVVTNQEEAVKKVEKDLDRADKVMTLELK